MLPESILIKSQKRDFTKEISGNRLLIVHVRHDDSCGNGHNTFAITGELYATERQPHESRRTLANGKIVYLASCGMHHDEIRKHYPSFAPYLKWHLCSTDGPTHYLANTMYHAGDKDCWGLRAGEKRQIKNGRTGNPSWELTTINGRDCTVRGISKYVDSPEQPKSPCEGLMYSPWYRYGEGKEPELELARKSAIWPEATLEQLQNEELLRQRLPGLMIEFKKAVESLGFVY